jgi:hypothetical protein
MFIDNEFTKKYFDIVSNANNRCPGNNSRRIANKLVGYVERHHIKPKSLGGPDDPENLVWLTAEEHLEVHLLLVNMVEDKESRRKMHSAAVRMCNPQSRNQQRLFKKDDYSELRKKCATLHSEYMKLKHAGSGNPFFNKKHTEESKKLISLGGKGLKRSDSTRKNLSKSKLGDKNPATRTVTCPHCNKTGKAGGMLKHHFNHCKLIKKGT